CEGPFVRRGHPDDCSVRGSLELNGYCLHINCTPPSPTFWTDVERREIRTCQSRYTFRAHDDRLIMEAVSIAGSFTRRVRRSLAPSELGSLVAVISQTLAFLLTFGHAPCGEIRNMESSNTLSSASHLPDLYAFLSVGVVSVGTGVGFASRKERVKWKRTSSDKNRRLTSR
ncbi:hypothetical protein BaRGS_00029757, partial [Batillaria attramentaria]